MRRHPEILNSEATASEEPAAVASQVRAPAASMCGPAQAEAPEQRAERGGAAEIGGLRSEVACLHSRLAGPPLDCEARGCRAKAEMEAIKTEVAAEVAGRWSQDCRGQAQPLLREEVAARPAMGQSCSTLCRSTQT